jgi:hypothetical protein
MIILKIIGILFIRDLINLIPDLLLSISNITYSSDLGSAVGAIIVTVLAIFVYLGVAYYFIFKTDYLINKLNLDSGFTQEDFPLNIHRSTVLSIVIIIIGGLLMADNIPSLCRSVYLYYENQSLTNGTSKPDLSYIIIYSLKILVGLVLTGNHQLLVNYIERKRRTPAVITKTATQDPE